MAEMTDLDLIGYCDMHCETQRALFNSDQVNRMLALAGHPEGYAKAIPPNQWISVYDEMKDLCARAKERLNYYGDKTIVAEGKVSNVLPFIRK